MYQNKKLPSSLQFILILFIIIWSLPVFGQSPHFNKYKIFKNKKDFSVNVIYQGNSGYLWFGTTEGLVRFDGIDYTYFTTENGLYNNNISSLFQDNQNKLWIGDKRGGISIYANDTIQLFDPEEGLSGELISEIYIDSKNTTWFSTEGEGIYYFSEKTKRLYNIWDEEGVSDYVYCIEEDPKGNIWIGTDQGITIFDAEFKKVKHMSMKNGLPDNIVKHIEYSGEDYMKIGMEEAGIINCNIKTYGFSNHLKLNKGSLNNFVSFLGEDIWISTVSDGIIRLKSDNITSDIQYLNIKNGILNNNTNTVYIDREKNLWIGSKNGVTQCNLNSFEFVTKKDGLSSDKIYSLINTHDNKQWFCTDQGLFLSEKHKPGEILLTDIFENQHPNTTFISLYYDKTGFVWAGTYNEGVFKINANTLNYTQFKTEDGLVDNNVIAITGNDSLLYFSTLGGGVSFTNINAGKHKFNTYNSKTGLQSDYVYQTFIDSKKRLWFAQDGGGLTIYENGIYTNFDKSSGLTSKSLYGIAEDDEQNIWCISADEGVFKYNGKTFENINIQDGLISSSYLSIIYDGNNNLILASNDGIEVLNTKTGSIRLYGEESGVAYLEPNLNAIFKDKNKNIWIGTNKGIIKYNFKKQENNDVKPLILFTKKQAFFKEINEDSAILNHNENHLIFNYTGLWYKSPEKLQYRHKLNGFDIDWIYSKNSKTQTYSNLPPGKYTFIVEVSHISDEWTGSSDAKFTFRIKPPFWKTWWFITLTVIIIILIIYFFFRHRLQKLTKAKEALEAEVKKRTSEILNQKEEIETQKEEIEYQNKEIKHSINYASRIQTALINSVTENSAVTEHFVLWKPRDVVSGDFYWIREVNNKLFYIAADSTGHGVPGAFMSMLGISFLDEIILRQKIEKPAEILEKLRNQIKLSLGQNEEFSESKDGMDMAVCVIDQETLKLEYAGAYNPMYLFRNNELSEYKATRNPVGVYAKEIPFGNTEIQLNKEDLIYIFSDGFVDQFGGEKGQKYKSRNFKEFVKKNHKEPIPEQHNLFNEEFKRWTGNSYSQIDDILVIGIKIL